VSRRLAAAQITRTRWDAVVAFDGGGVMGRPPPFL
jgi:hypothetical protein